MSKFADKLKRVFRNPNHAIGFRKPSADEETSSILILIDITSSPLKRIKELVSAGVDAFLVNSSESNMDKIIKAAGDIPLGVGLTGAGHQAALTKDTAYDFVVIDLKAKPDMPGDDSTGKLLVVTETMAPGMIKAINDLDISVEGVVIDFKDSPIDMQFILTCHLFGDLLNKPLLVKIYKSDVTDSEIKALNVAGVRGLLLPADTPVAQIKNLKKYIASLPASTRKGKNETALIPGFSFGQKETEEVEEVEDDE